MAKSVDNSVLDAALTEIATATRMSLCSGEPANFAGIAAVAKADAVMTGGDYTIADGDTSGRKTTVAAQAGEAVDVTEAACTHVALDDGTTLLYVTTCTSIAVTSGGTVDFPAWDIEIADPT